MSDDDVDAKLNIINNMRTIVNVLDEQKLSASLTISTILIAIKIVIRTGDIERCVRVVKWLIAHGLASAPTWPKMLSTSQPEIEHRAALELFRYEICRQVQRLSYACSSEPSHCPMIQRVRMAELTLRGVDLKSAKDSPALLIALEG